MSKCIPDAAVHIVGTERSGTNLLRQILTSHSDMAIPHPPHLLRYFASLEPLYGDLELNENFRELAGDILRLVRWHIHPWPDVPHTATIMREVPSRDVIGIYVALYRWYARQEGKPRWGCKSTFTVDQVEHVHARLPNARFIWLVRDPRDVAASSKESVFNPCHPVLTSRLWQRQQLECLRLERLLPRTHWLRLRYEDLVSEPERTVREVCQFIELPFEQQMLMFFTTAAARRTAGLSRSWRNTGRPILVSRVGRFREALTPREVSAVELMTASTLDDLGYPRTEAAPEPLPSGIEVRLTNALGRCSVELASLKSDANHWLRWRRDFYVAALSRWLHLRSHFSRSDLPKVRPLRFSGEEGLPSVHR
jgi:hypothetical protein